MDGSFEIVGTRYLSLFVAIGLEVEAMDFVNDGIGPQSLEEEIDSNFFFFF